MDVPKAASRHQMALCKAARTHRILQREGLTGFRQPLGELVFINFFDQRGAL